jgi:beta-lactam-binding protein with PASTA domain
VGAGQNPLVGWFVPTPVDGSVEMFGPTGESHGRLAIDSRSLRTTWEDTPQPGAAPVGVGDPAERIGNAALARVARSLIDADRMHTPARRSDSALGALLRVIETTVAHVDTTGGTGTGQLGLLLGTPLAVVRVGVTVDVDDPQATGFGTLAEHLVPVRLGSLVRLTDGVIAFWAEDHPDRVYPVHPLVADVAAPLPGEPDASGPITHPYLERSPVVWCRPGSMRTLTVLVAPGAQLSVTTGLAPQKSLDLLAEWTSLPAGALAPTLAFDAVLRSPEAIAVPTADEINGVWSWLRRPPGGTTWAVDELATDPTAVGLGDAPSRVEDGYLRVRLLPPSGVKGAHIRIGCVSRDPATGAIRGLGVLRADGSTTRMSLDAAIRQSELGRVTFVVGSGEQRIEVYLGDGTGPLAGLPNCPEPTTVPDVVDMLTFSARPTIVAAGLVVDPETRRFDGAPVDQVIGQTPAAGIEVEPGTPVGLTVSTIRREFPSAVPVDHVIDQRPTVGEPVAPGSAIALTVSDGAGVAVPVVIGAALGNAQATLSGLGLTAVIDRYVASTTAPAGTVVGQVPTGDTVVRPGTTVSLYVSGGPGVEVPWVTRETRGVARQRIVDAGLLVGWVQQDYDDIVPAGLVSWQTPLGGTRVLAGESVGFTVSLGRREGTIPG